MLFPKNLDFTTVFVFSFDDFPLFAEKTSFLGGKGAGLADLIKLNVQTPPGFIISTELCRYYYEHNGTFPSNFKERVLDFLKILENKTKKCLGSKTNPLFLSVRSGAKVSMPGMMETFLNIGLNEVTFQKFSTILNSENEALFLYEQLKSAYIQENIPFCENAQEQLFKAIELVLKSWMSKRAIAYRKLYKLPQEAGTAVIIQAMVFGNAGPDSGTGVVFTRNPSIGEKSLFGEYLLNAQGDALVSGKCTPKSIENKDHPSLSLQSVLPTIYQQLSEICHKLETHYKDLQEIEFTIENGKLWILQTRSGKRSPAAALSIALSLEKEGVINEKELFLRIDPNTFSQLLHPQLKNEKVLTFIGKGLPSSPGVGVGKVVLDIDQCIKLTQSGESSILIRPETCPEDLEGLSKACGILTAQGGMTSHAAVVARGMGKPCITGMTALSLHTANHTFSFGEKTFKEGEILTIDGNTGKVFLGKGVCECVQHSLALQELLKRTEKNRRMKIYANAETPKDIFTAYQFGAQGVGLCRTEHMFFEKTRTLLVQKLTLASCLKERNSILQQLAPLQEKDFYNLLTASKGKEIVIRLLDPPLHEFLPKTKREIVILSQSMNLPIASIEKRIQELKEINPMLGYRGCRLGILIPEIYHMQAKALQAAANQCLKNAHPIKIAIMVPFIMNEKELLSIKNTIMSSDSLFSFGAMIELPRAALTADVIAPHVDFLSFGTNDLTQMTLGISRDDCASFMPFYYENHLYPADPFVTLDIKGVGELISMACQKARETNPLITLGVCGEHAADPFSIEFFESIGIDYLSCSPYRVPQAQLAATQAFVKNNIVV